MQKNIVILSYGNEIEYRRSIFCVLSFFAWSVENKHTILIYTDNPEFFKLYLHQPNISYYLLTPELLTDMLGEDKFLHRIKVSVVRLTFQNFPHRDLLFLDSDTFFVGSSSKVFKLFKKGVSLMHKMEYTLGDSLRIFSDYKQSEFPEAFLKYISSHEFIINSKTEKFTAEDYSWNSGVLGLTEDFAIYKDDILKLTDEFYANSKWFISEQLAFSLILQRKTQIKRTDHVIVHYWNKVQKTLIDDLLMTLFTVQNDMLNSLTFIRFLTRKYKKDIEIDLILKEACSAFVSKNYYYGIKKAIQISFKSPSSLFKLWNLYRIGKSLNIK